MFTTRHFALGVCLFFNVLVQTNAYSQVQTAAYYVSPSGSDSNTGLSPGSPFQSLERAQNAARASTVKTIYLRGGVYSRRAPLVLIDQDAGESWLGYAQEIPILDGGQSTAQAFAITSSKITIRWLKIQNFAQRGIESINSTQLFIDSNTITDIACDGWNEGGITLQNGIDDAVISHNLIQNSGYAGILSANGVGDFRGSVRIENNKIFNTCTDIADCGAIYSDDRGHHSQGVIVKNNIIGNFGNGGTEGRGIYLDDEQSNATVTGNIVYGSGSWPLQIHGGDHNLIRNNIFDISGSLRLGLYQYIDTGNFPDYGMQQNQFTCNIIYFQNYNLYSLWEDRSGGFPMVQVSNNIYWSPNMKFSSVETLDQKPSFVDPGFVNPVQYDYHFKAAVPAFCAGDAFQPTDLSSVGPLPNL